MAAGSLVQEIFQKIKLPDEIGLVRIPRWLSLDRSDDEENYVIQDNQSGQQQQREWTPPTIRTKRLIETVFRTFVSEEHTIDTHIVESALTRCPPEENILQIEDRDHYNLLHKAVIYDCVPLVNILMNHGSEVNWTATESCSVSRKCPHNKLGALHFACYLGRKDIVDVLLRWGADKTSRRRVHTSAVVNCPANCQPQALGSGQPEEVVEILSRCGDRHPAFFTVLGDHAGILQSFVAASPRPDPAHAYLVHLACRVGSYNCLKYLLDLYPSEVNRVDSDGLPTLIMAMRHGLKFVHLLLAAGGDVTLLDDLWEQGANALHFLFRALPYPDMRECSLAAIIRHCLENGVNINAQRQPSNYTPLHDLISVVNIVPIVVDLIKPEKSLGSAVEEMNTLDRSITEVVSLLLRCGADHSLADSNGKPPIQTLLMNGNHTVRCNAARDASMPENAQSALRIRDYGLANTLSVLKTLIKYGVSMKSNKRGVTPLKCLIELMCSSYFGSTHWSWHHSLEILNTGELLDAYCSIASLLLENGCNPNICCEDGLPPLLYLLSHITDSPYVEDYIVSVETARAVSRVVCILLKHGAKTECEVDTRHRGIRWIGCFDLLVAVLETMQDYPHSRHSRDLTSLRILLEPLLQYGARAVVFQKLLYGDPGTLPDARLCYFIPTHSFLYQYLQFGALNLQFVVHAPFYEETFHTLCNISEHFVLCDVMRTLRVQFSAMHDLEDCACGSPCWKFAKMIQEQLRIPRQLKNLCRLVIVTHTTPMAPASVQRLNLPTLLRQYILSLDQ